MATIPTTIKSKELVEKRREQIALAAISLFSKKGFFKSTLKELAEEAGISHGNIYDYIGTKEDIFYLLHKYIDKLAIDALHRSVKNIDDPLERLRRMVRTEFNLMYEWADAILLIYQEGHVLNKTLLKKMLQRETTHMRLYESALEEAIQRKHIRECNVRAISHLIKSMVDTWVLKRWDLRDKLTQLEMEKSILDLVFYGLITDGASESRSLKDVENLKGKLILVINSGTVFGKSFSSFLLAKNVRLVLHVKRAKKNITLPSSMRLDSGGVKIYSEKEYGPMGPDLLRKIIKDFGSIDIVIQDLGISDLETTASLKNIPIVAQNLDANLVCAQNISSILEEELKKKGWGKILYVAPWFWDTHLDPVRYEIVKAGTIALTQTMAKRLAAARINVNCIVPGYIGGIKNLNIQKVKTSELLEEIPMKCLGELSDLVETANFLITDHSKYLTGQVIETAGGKH
jgi:3-oxoacyl-[acyl-carrier protein] reductase